MFVALRDLAYAKGRFLLIGAVVALITVLVGFLAGLTGGLANQNISAVLAMPGDRIVLGSSGASGASFSDSALSTDQQRAWERTAGVTAVEPVGIAQTRAEIGGTRVGIAAFGVEPTYAGDAPRRDGTLTLSADAADQLGARAGSAVTIAGTSYTVGAVGAASWYSHTPVVLMTLADFQHLAASTGSPDTHATAFAVTGKDVDWDAAAAATGTVADTHLAALGALEAFRSEVGSLLMMVAMLFGISALVIGAFFTVWTMQRTGDIAVLKALGASTRSLVRDALGQALLVLAIGIGVGIGLVAALGAIAGIALPFLLSPLTTLVPGAIMIALGLAGAAVALRTVTAADPLTALGSAR